MNDKNRLIDAYRKYKIKIKDSYTLVNEMLTGINNNKLMKQDDTTQQKE